VKRCELSTYEIEPLRDPRWPDLVRRHPAASVFHSSEWLEALQRTYRYEPIAYTTSPPGTELTNGWAFCRIDSWLTGNRLVSLPFSDHCDPLLSNLEDWDCLAQRLQLDQQREKWKYIEFRPRATAPVVPDGFRANQTFYLHKLNLGPSTDQLFRSLHKDSTQRKIRRAEREGLTYEEGLSGKLLDKFEQLLILTRRRHRVPPQPRRWFSNLLMCLGERVKIHVASRHGQPLASILTLRFRDTLVYKYGGSDTRYQNMGGMHLCLWRAIEGAKEAGLKELDLGRSDPENRSLITFKDRWGADRCATNYFRQWLNAPTEAAYWQTMEGRKAMDHMPNLLREIVGRLLYRHFG
jgi:hypothetical protein